MKQLPDEKELAELLEMGRSLEEKARKLYEMATIMAIKCELRAEKRQAAKQKQESSVEV